MWEVFFDFKIWWFFLFIFVCNIFNGGFNVFFMIIIKGFGFIIFEIIFMLVFWGVVCMFGNGVIGLCIFYIVGKWLFLMVFVIILFMIGIVVMYIIFYFNKVLLLFVYYIIGFYNVFYVMLLVFMVSNIVGITKKSVISVIIWMFYCGGNIVGSFFYRSKDVLIY